jgi:MFS family permease
LAKRHIYYGWWVLASSVVITYLSGTALFGFPAYYPSFISTFGWSRAQLLFGNTILQWAFGMTGLLWGTVADKGGVRLVLSIGSACVALAYLLFGQMSALWQLYAIAFIFGAGLSAMGYLTNQILQARWFVRRRGLAIGVVNSAGGLGGSVAPVLVTSLVARFGWRSAMSLMDVFFWTLPFLLILLVVREHPKELGLFPDGAANAAETGEFGRGKRLLTTPMNSLGEIFRTPVFWVVIGSVFVAAGTIGTTLHILILYLRDLGFSQQVAASALSLEFALSFIGRLGFGVLSDRFSARKVGVVSFVLLGLSSLLLFVARSPGMLIAFVILHGLGHGAIVSFFPLILAEAFGTQKHLGRLLAVGHLAYAGGLGTIPIISGYAFDSTGSFAIGFAINSITTWLACGGLVAIGLGGRAIQRESSRS